MASIRTDVVPLKVNGNGARAYLTQPHDEGKYPGLVMIQEWWGLEPHIMGLAQKTAVEGFVTIIPDLYHGVVATEPDDARREVMNMMSNIQRAMQEVHGALQYLSERPDVDPKKIGIIGFCMGGRVTLNAAENFPEIAAAVAFYPGGYKPTPESVTGVKAPVRVFYGEKDGGIPMTDVEHTKSIYQAAGKDFEARVFPSGHAFLNPDHGAYDAQSAVKAWAEAINFLKQQLQ